MISGISGTDILSYLPQMRQSQAQNRAPSAEEIFSKIDTDGDGAVSKEEFKKDHQAREAEFQNYAANSQSGLSSFLFDFLYGLGESDSTDGATEDAVSAAVELETGAPSTEEIFSAMDTDGDGVVSEEEFVSFEPDGPEPPSGAPSAEEMFSEIDTDGDGSISKDELEEHHQAREAEFQNYAANSQTDISSFLDSLLQAADENSTTSTSASDQIGTEEISSLLAQLIDKYLLFAQANQSTTITSLVDVKG
jgi:Ca2+-binding EF-hand superfamily protein